MKPIVLGVALGCMISTGVHAQENIDVAPQLAGEPGPAPGRKIIPQKEPAAPSSQAYQIGSFLVYPEVVLSEMYDDNVYATQSNRISDFATIVSPAVWFQSNWKKHVLKFEVGADSARYHSQTSQNSNDYRYSIEGRYDINPQTNVYGGVRRAQEHEDRESPDFRNGFFPTLYHSIKGYAGVFRQFEKLSVRLGGTAQKLEFDNVPFSFGVINNSDRNRMLYTGGARIAYELSPKSEVYLQTAVDDRRYQNKPDDAGYIRDSNGERLLVGTRVNLPRKLRADVFVGHMTQRYQDFRLGTVSTPMLGANVNWYQSDSTTLSAYLDRTIEETTVFQTIPVTLPASSYVNSYGALTLDHKYSSKLSASANLSYSRNAFQGFPRIDNYGGVGAGAVYQLGKGLFLDASFQHRWLRSDFTPENFDRNILFLRLAFALSPS